MKKSFPIILFLFLQISSSLAGDIEGKVTDLQSGKDIAGAIVKLVKENRDTLTDDSGQFVFQDIAEGEYSILIKHKDYKSVTVKRVSVMNDKITKVTIKMRRHTKKIQMYSYNRAAYNNNRKDKSKVEKESGRSLPDVKIEYEDIRTSEKDKKAEKSVEEFMAVSTPPVAQKSGLKAGYADDNQQFNYYLGFLEKYGNEVEHYPINIRERIKIEILDSEGKPVPNIQLGIFAGEKKISKTKTYANGGCYIYPNEMNWSGNDVKCRFTYKDEQREFSIKRDGPRTVTIRLKNQRIMKEALPLDLLFILDTTGSMGEEIERLKQTIEIINMNISSLKAKINIRYGMVLYRDKEDEYVTKRIPFTSDLEAFRKELQKIKADGGGDTPEDLQSALKIAVQKMDWNKEGVRLAFIITDASTHLDYGAKFTYASAARLAREKAIKIFSIGTGGLAIDGEYILRQIAQFTNGKYIFLTYGEKGESEGGTVGSVSHHTGSNFQTDKLETIIIRFTKEELANLIEISLQEEQSFFQAKYLDTEEKEETLQTLFIKAVWELKDFSSLAITDKTKLSIIPISVNRESLANNAEYFTERLTLAMRKHSSFKMIERKDLQFITQEIGLQLSGVIEIDDAVKVGELLGADMLLIGNMFFKDGNYDLYLKLVRVQTAEVLSVTKLIIDPKLGL